MRQDIQDIIDSVELKGATVTFNVGFLNEIQLQIEAQVYYFQYRNQEECLADYHDLKNYIKTHQ
jgi:hypothetical protein